MLLEDQKIGSKRTWSSITLRNLLG